MAPLAQILSQLGGLVARSSLVPPEIMALKPPGMDERTFALSLPAMSGDAVPKGADRTMTLDGPDQVWFLVVAITCIAISGLFLMIRVYTKVAIVRSFELADWFILVSFPLIVTEIGLGYNMVKWGSGVHQWQVTLDQLFHQLYWANIAQIVYCPLSFAVKMAILLQYLRLFAPSKQVNRTMWYGAWMMIISCSVLYFVLIFWTAFYCYPRQAIWDKLTPGLKCHDVNNITLAQGSFNMVSDVIILLLPTTGLWKLNIPMGRKIAVTILFATGLLACIASAMRIVFTVKIAPVYNEADVSHNALFIGLWTEAEVSLGFIVACALCLPKLIQAKAHRIKRVVSKASSPFSTLRSNISSSSRAGTFNLNSSQNTTSTVQSVRLPPPPPPPPPPPSEPLHANVEKQSDQNGYLDPNAFQFPVATAASSLYSPDASQQNSRIPSPVPSPTSVPGDVAPRELRNTIDEIQQFRFETELKQSMEGAQRGLGNSHLS